MLLNFLGSPDTAWNDTLQFLIATLEFTITTTSCVGSIRRLNSQPFTYKLEAIPNPCSLDLKLIWLVTLHSVQDIYTIRFSNITRYSQCTIMMNSHSIFCNMRYLRFGDSMPIPTDNIPFIRRFVSFEIIYALVIVACNRYVPPAQSLIYKTNPTF